jgi:hypothetical protein
VLLAFGDPLVGERRVGLLQKFDDGEHVAEFSFEAGGKMRAVRVVLAGGRVRAEFAEDLEQFRGFFEGSAGGFRFR